MHSENVALSGIPTCNKYYTQDTLSNSDATIPMEVQGLHPARAPSNLHECLTGHYSAEHNHQSFHKIHNVEGKNSKYEMECTGTALPANRCKVTWNCERRASASERVRFPCSQDVQFLLKSKNFTFYTLRLAPFNQY